MMAVDMMKIPRAALKENALETSPSGETGPPFSNTHIPHIPANKTRAPRQQKPSLLLIQLNRPVRRFTCKLIHMNDTLSVKMNCL